MLKNRIILLIIPLFVIFLLTGCANKENIFGKADTKALSSKPPVYTKNTSEYLLVEGANPYKMAFSEYGFAYYVESIFEINEGEEEVYQSGYDIYLQPFESAEAVKIGFTDKGYIVDLFLDESGNSTRLFVYTRGDIAVLSEYDITGTLISETLLDDYVNKQVLSNAIVLNNGTIVVSLENEVVFLDQTGSIKGSVTFDGYLRKLLCAENGKPCGIIESKKSGKTVVEFCEFHPEISAVKVIVELPENCVDAWNFQGEIANVDSSFISVSYSEGEAENIVDLDKQGFFGSQIRYIFGNKEEIKIVSVDETDKDGIVFLYKLTEKQGTEDAEIATGDAGYAEDGRKIVKVVIPDNCIFQVDYHVKKYNQTSDTAFIEVEKLSEPLEDYLGKGNRPDIIMFEDSTEVADYVNKGLLEEITPLVSEEDKYLFDDIIPKAKELCCVDDKLYSVGGLFWMMCMVSNGQESGDDGKCSTTDYFRWYDAYMNGRSISGIGRVENLLYASVPDFYDEETGKVDFESEEFKDLMLAYKTVCENHKGQISQQEVTELFDYQTFLIASGPRRYISYGDGLFDSSLSLEGIPCIDGSRRIFMKIEYPMGILSTSDSKIEAADFILYFTSISEYLQKGYSERDLTLSPYTLGLFSIYKENLDYEILKSDRPFTSAELTFEDGVTRRQEFYYTQEQCDHLLELIDEAVPDSREHIMIYNMMLEEIDGYINGNKNLDECCKVLQRRVELYINENR